MLFYSALLGLALLVSSPWWLLRMATTERYREGLHQRLGGVPTALRAAASGRRVVWLHAVSVGEVLAATRLVAELETSLGEGWIVVISTTTRTGQALARERFGADRVFYMPLDFALTVRRYLHALKPELLILMESELWPRMLHECRTRNISVAVVNARVSDRSFKRGEKFRSLWGHILRMVPLWLVQSDEDARRLIVMGADADSVKISGNLKFDIRAPKRSSLATLIRGVAEGRPIIVYGSTTAAMDDQKENDEEELLADFFTDMKEFGHSTLAVIAPRHPERFARVSAYLESFRPKRVSQLVEMQERELEGHRADIILLDTIGDLAALYALADLAFVGGSLVPRGGHNPLEPAQFGVPVIMGPHYANFRDIVNKMKDADGIRIVADTVELRATLESLLTDRELAQAIGRRGQQVFEEQQGATARTVAALTALVRGENA
jgi:3-deoxy-D-manno-octulosonic-acid transferase